MCESTTTTRFFFKQQQQQQSDFSLNNNLLLVFLNLLFLGTYIIFFSQALGLSLGLFYFILFFCTLYFGLACDDGNSFLCLEE